ncbi:collagen binding domain-containing protein, partial [Candidatus Altiarchaeota archaeon]
EEDDDNLEIDGEDLEVELNPEYAGISDEITAYVEDEDGDEFNSVSVKVTQLGSDNEWEEDDEYLKRTTNRDGELTFVIEDERDFEDDPEGSYQVDVWKRDYCKQTFTLNIGNDVEVAGPEPANPVVGEEFSFRFVNSEGEGVQGVMAVINTGTQLMRQESDSEGYARFTSEKSGSFEVVLSGRGLEETIVRVTVQEKGAPRITISPNEPEVGDEVKVTVVADGGALASSSVKVTLPDKTTSTYSTNSNGEVSFQASEKGEYLVEVDEELYRKASKKFTVNEVLEGLRVSLNPETPSLGDEVEVIVEDSTGNVVSGVKIEVSGVEASSGQTDQYGIYLFTVSKLGVYEVKASKQGYQTKTSKIELKEKLNLHLSLEDVSAGDELEVTVLDILGHEVSATIILKHGEDVVAKQTGSKAVFTPQFPGEHTIEAVKDGFAKAEETISVGPRPLDVSYDFSEEDKLEITISSRDEVIAGITLTVTTPDGLETELTTDDYGRANVDALDPGEYLIRVASENFQETEVTAEKTSSNYGWLILAALSLMIVILALTIAVVYLNYYNRLKKPTKTSRLSEI